MCRENNFKQYDFDRKYAFTKNNALYVCKTRRKVKKHVTRFDMPIGCFKKKLKFRFTKIVDHLCKNVKYLYLHIVSKFIRIPLNHISFNQIPNSIIFVPSVNKIRLSCQNQLCFILTNMK